MHPMVRYLDNYVQLAEKYNVIRPNVFADSLNQGNYQHIFK